MTEPDGTFSFTDVHADSSTLTAITERHSLAVAVRMLLDPGQTVGTLRLVVTKPVQLIARFVDAGGKAIEGVELTALGWTAPGTTHPFSLPLEVLRRERVPIPRSDRTGEMLINDLPADVKCSLLFQHPEFAAHSLVLPTNHREPTKVVLQPGVPLTVETVAAGTREPIKDIRVYLSAYGDSQEIHASDLVDSRGRWTMRLADIRSGQVSVRGHGKHTTFEYADLNNWASETEGRTIRFELRRTAKLTGRVVDSAGKTLEGVTIGVVSPSGQAFYSGVSDAHGRYILEAPEGPLKVTAAPLRGYYLKPENQVAVTLISERTTVAADLVADRMPILRGTVTTDGRPVPQSIITGERDERTVAGAEGQFGLGLLHDPSPRFVSMLASHPTKRLSGEAVVSGDKIDSGELVRIDLSRESTLRGKVADSRGKGIAGCPVTLWGSVAMAPRSVRWRIYQGVTNERGEYVFSGLNRHATYRVGVFQNSPRIDKATDFRELPDDEIRLDVPPLEDEDVRALSLHVASLRAPVLRIAEWINSSPVNLKDLRGKVVYVSAWSTRLSLHPDAQVLQSLHDLYSKKGLVVVGIHNNSKTADELKKYARERNLTVPIAVDNALGETLSDDVWGQQPYGLIIGRGGRVLTIGVWDDVLRAVRHTMLYDESPTKP